MQCPKCRHENPDGTELCVQCGAGLSGEASPGTASGAAAGQGPARKQIPAVPTVLILVGILAVLGYFFYRGGGEPQIDSPVKCWSCEFTEFRKARIGEATVGKCPKCGKETLAPAWRCPNPECGELVVSNEYRNLPPPTKCPKCGTEVRHGDSAAPQDAQEPTTTRAGA